MMSAIRRIGCRWALLGVAAGALVASGCGGGSDAAATVDGKPAGTISFYTYWLSDEADAAIKAFNREYPDIHVRVYREGGPTIDQRFTAEQQTKQDSADVISIDEPYMKALDQAGYLMQWTPPEASTLPAALKRDSYVGIKSYINGTIVNTDVFGDRADWPRSWSDFANPKPSWDGKVCTGDARTLSHAYSTVVGQNDVLGPERTKAIYAGLGRAHAKLYTGAPQAAEQVASGQCGILFQIPYQNYAHLKQQGAHVAWVAPKPGMVPMTSFVGVVRNTENAPAAKAFVSFLLSKRGQRAFTDLNLTPAQPNAPTSWWISKSEAGRFKPSRLMRYDESKANDPREALLRMWTGALHVAG